ncbi:MAG: hypothetical protein V1655_03445 [bacterium]
MKKIFHIHLIISLYFHKNVSFSHIPFVACLNPHRKFVVAGETLGDSILKMCERTIYNREIEKTFDGILSFLLSPEERKLSGKEQQTIVQERLLSQCGEILNNSKIVENVNDWESRAEDPEEVSIIHSEIKHICGREFYEIDV